MSEPPSPWPEGPQLPVRRPLIELLPPAGPSGWSGWPPALSGEPPRASPVRPRYGLALLLFSLTLLSTITLSPVMYIYSRTDVSTILPLLLTPGVAKAVWSDPALLRIGLQFALAAMTILFAHEMGHYVACRRYGLACTLPYFLPVPINFGTFGAFIKIKEPIRDKRELFDVGVAGPIAGFVALIPFLLYGVAHSQWVPIHPAGAAANAPQSLAVVLAPGKCLAILLASRLFHGPLHAGMYLNLHPMALGAWLGLLATSINLLPLGQLDGGHILYAATGRWQRRLALPLWLGLALLGWLWQGWLVWTVIVLVIGLYHPPVWDERQPLDGKRRAIALLALLIFILSFMPVPLTELAVS
jgi:membrane-associated protease RseP (regulator of RpoE activity)